MTATLLLLIAGAAPPADTPEEKYQRLRAEFFEATGRTLQYDVVERYAPRFFAHAERYEDDASAVEAMLDLVGLSAYGTETRRKSEEKLASFVTSRAVTRSLLRGLGMSDREVQSKFLRDVREQHPDARVRALGWRAVVNGRTSSLRTFRRIYTEDRLAKMEADRDERIGKLNRDNAARIRADFVKWEKEIAEANEKLRSKELSGALADLSIGAKAPPTRAVDLSGEGVSLGDHKGKVVVMDFWFVNCGPCRRMIPMTNALAKEMRGRPFVPVSVNTDGNKGRAVEFQKATPMAGASWWVGPDSPVLEAWDVESYPTAYVIDHEGVIRHRRVDYDPKDDKIPDLVRELVRKAEAAKRRAP